MDLWIPELGGENAIALVKQNEKTKNIPIIIFSANTDIGNISGRINADGYLKKPFSINTFIETIKKHLEYSTL